MFSYFKKRREAIKRKAGLKHLAESLGEALRLQLDAFIEIEIVPVRKAYIEILQERLAGIDQQMTANEYEGETDKEVCAAKEARIMLDNWTERNEERLDKGRNWLSEQFEEAEVFDVHDDFDKALLDRLNEQYLILVSDGLAEINKLMGREVEGQK